MTWSCTLFYVSLCLTGNSQCLLSSNIRDTNAGGQLLQALSEKKEEQIFEIIDKVLKQVFGECATMSIYKHLQNRYSLSQSEFSYRIDVFAKGLEDFLSSGAYVIESRILNEIYSSYGSENSVNFNVMFEEPDFANQVRTATQNV